MRIALLMNIVCLALVFIFLSCLVRICDGGQCALAEVCCVMQQVVSDLHLLARGLKWIAEGRLC